MAAPITFSGFNNIDFSTVIDTLIQQDSVPLTNLQTQQSNLSAQSTNYSSLATQLGALDTAAQALSDPSSISTLSATSSNPGAVSVQTTSGAAAGHYDVVVQTLARAQVTASTSTSPDANTTDVATGGTLTIGGVAVNVTGPVTLQGLANQINSTSGIGVTATVVRSAANSYRLVLTGQNTGAAASFTITNGLTGGTGVTFADADGNGISGDTPSDNAVNASDATALVNNVEVSGSTNTITGAVPGVTLTLLQQDPTTTVGVDVSTDSTGLENTVNSFITAYNSLVSFMNTQATNAANGDQTSIGDDSLVRELRQQLTSTLSQAYSGGVFTNLSQVGIEFTQTGTLQLNQANFQAAVASNGADVAQIFSGTGGAFTAVDGLLTEYSQAGGFISTVQTSLTQEGSQIANQITAMQARLATEKTSLQAEFTAADTAIATLNSQTSAIANLGATLSSSPLTQSN